MQKKPDKKTVTSEWPELDIHTDGACSGNPGPGGWAAILDFKGLTKEISGGEDLTTNNRMELQAVIEGLKQLNKPCRVNLHSDSSYVVNAFRQGWLENWQRRGWKNSAKEPVANRDLWEELLKLTKRHEVRFVKVKGHADDAMNNRADELAYAESQKRKR